MSKEITVPRRTTLKGIGAAGITAAIGSCGTQRHSESERTEMRFGRNIHPAIGEKVMATPLIDTHEHLPEERSRLSGNCPLVRSDDWSFILSHYLDSDLLSAGMSPHDYDRFFLPGVEPQDKWKILAPWWPTVQNTGYGRAVEISLRELYQVPELSGETVREVQSGYERARKAGLYRTILHEKAGIESCQVNSLEGVPFKESDMPGFLMQDLSIVWMFAEAGAVRYAGPTGIDVRTLADWHGVIDWWFQKYGRYAVAVKSQNAYSRNIDYEDVPPERVEKVFRGIMAGNVISPKERTALEDHLFWYAARKAAEYDLPIKMHTGYYAQWAGKADRMPLGRVMMNPAAATALCETAPEIRFIFMHICWPYYEDMIAVAKQNPNAFCDMCWAWIINPVASKDFLKKFLVTAPANKILTFGGDYIPVEPVLGHAVIARNGIALALSELVDEGWMNGNVAVEIADRIMHGNARSIFRLPEKEKLLSTIRWD